MGKKPVKCCLTQKTPNLPDCGILFLCDTYCLSLESVSYREHALEMLILILSVCLEAIPCEAEAALLLSIKVAFTW